ncbi:MAG: DMT family transporter [Steroidobacter sp.]
MPLLALVAILLAALCHASWNLAAKRAADCRYFVWIYSLIAVVIWLPVVIWVFSATHPVFGAPQYFALIGTAVLHLGYSLSLQAGYRAADLSVVYPVARGLGPVLSFVGAAIFLQEKPGITSITGLLLVITGIVLVTGLLHKGRQLSVSGLSWGVVTGTFIASYTLNDGYAVKVLMLHPLVVDITGNIFRVLVLSPGAINNRDRAFTEIKQYWRPAMMVSVLGTIGYVLVLFAMKIAPVSHIAPARELSMLVGTYLGARVLKEAVTTERVIGAACIVGGVVTLAF